MGFNQIDSIGLKFKLFKLRNFSGKDSLNSNRMQSRHCLVEYATAFVRLSLRNRSKIAYFRTTCLETLNPSLFIMTNFERISLE